MATNLAIAAVSQAICELLTVAALNTEFSGVSFRLVRDADLSALPADEVTLRLYQITPNAGFHGAPPRGAPGGLALAVDLHNILTPRPAEGARGQIILEWCMAELVAQPILTAGLLNRAGQAASFRPEETVELVLESLSLADLAAVQGTPWPLSVG